MIGSTDFSLDPVVVGVIAGMVFVTVITKLGGLWLLSQFEVSDRLEAGISVLPGAIVIAILAPELADGGPPEWGAALVAGMVMWRTGNILLTLIVGVFAVILFRAAVP